MRFRRGRGAGLLLRARPLPIFFRGDRRDLLAIIGHLGLGWAEGLEIDLCITIPSRCHTHNRSY